MINYYERAHCLNEYRIEHHISPNVDYSIWSFVNDTSGMIDFAGLFTIIIAAGIVASEFNWGTIKLLLIRPIKRVENSRCKIYDSFVVWFIHDIYFVCLILDVLGALLFGMPENAVPYLNYYEGEITEQSMPFHLLIFYGFKSISMFMLATMAFMISAVFRNSSSGNWIICYFSCLWAGK